MSPEAEGPVVARRRGSAITRIAALGALAFVVIAIAYVLLSSGDGGNQYRLLFETGGQLVKGNQVLIGGQPVGTVDAVTLTDNSEAEVKITVDRELHEGTEAVIRSTSLSGIANRYVSITPGPDNARPIPDDGVITQVDTTTPVDLDQLFDTFRKPARQGLRDIIRGYGTAYTGHGEEANLTYLYLNPSLVATDQLFRELSDDQQVLTRFLVNGAGVTSALAERRNDLSSLVSNANQTLGAIASQNVALDRSLKALPPAMRQADTTFVNLRAAFDDLDSFVAASKPATKHLAPFLKKLGRTAQLAVPVFRNLHFAVRNPGSHNDLAEFTKDLSPVEAKARNAFPQAIKAEGCSATDPTPCGSPPGSDPPIRFIRPYSPELLAAIAKLGQITAFYDGNGHFARIMSLIPLFHWNSGTEELDPFMPVETVSYSDLEFPVAPENSYRRCPGGATQPNAGWPAPTDHPFLDGGLLTSGVPPADCNATQVPAGP
jgi:phospholipid/cholesterol/gamma-HCH transport system substrate-binding protein